MAAFGNEHIIGNQFIQPATFTWTGASANAYVLPPPMVAPGKKPETPLEWLRRRVDEITELVTVLP